MSPDAPQAPADPGAPAALETLEGRAAGVVRHHAPVSVDGLAVGATATPPDEAALAEVLRELAAAGLAVLPRGTGTQTALGNAPARADVFLSTAALRGVDDFDPAEGVCHARAGTPLAELRAAVEAEGWALPLDDAGRGSSLGGALATAALAPRAQGLGRPRDVVLGCEVALVDGTLTRCGGRVVKNVTGYDLARLYVGSLGILGVVTGAWLRLRPLPERTLVLETPALPLREACRRGVALARRPTVRACALIDADAAPGAGANGRTLRAVVELAGDAPGVERDREALEREAGAAPADAAATEAAFGGPAPGTPELRLAVSSTATRLGDCAATLADAGAALRVLPGLGLVRARLAPDAASAPDRSSADRVFDAAAHVARTCGGRLLCEAAPPAAKRGRDVFASPAAEARLTRALKARFDPRGALNPGRGPGGA